MQKWRMILVIGLALGLVFVLFGFAAGQRGVALASCQRYVLQVGGANTGDCSDVNSPCKTIQYAIDQATDGDHICVAKHTVTGPLVYEESLTIDQNVHLDGAWQASCTVGMPSTCTFDELVCDPKGVTIDALGVARVVTIKGEIAPTIDCFTITGGDAVGMGGDPGETVDNDAGGGIFSTDAAPIIIHNIISANYGCDFCAVAYGRGGGIYLINAPSSTLIQDNLIVNNVADESTWGQGGGIMLRDSYAQVFSNTIRYNRAGHSAGEGGGVAIRGGAPQLVGNRLEYNIGGPGVRGLGGGIYVWSDEPAVIANNQIEYNQAISGVGDAHFPSRGGGIYYAGDPSVAGIILDNTIQYNTASPLAPQLGQGGGIFLSGFIHTAQVSGNSLVGNVAGYNHDGQGGGFYIHDSTLTVSDNYLAENSATWAGGHGDGGGFFIDGGQVTLVENDIFANYGAGFPGFPSTASGYGGGVAARHGDTLLQDNSIGHNSATNGENSGMGGGVFIDGGEVILLHNGITENLATLDEFGFGGGVAISGSLSIVDANLIEGNKASADLYGAGGGIYTLSAYGQFSFNTIQDNQAAAVDQGYGGGAYFESSTIWMDANTILDNQASPITGYGGGLRMVTGTSFTLTNNIIARNLANTEGSGLAALAGSSGILIHNTIADHLSGDGVGVHVKTNAHLTLFTNIISNHTVGILNLDFPLSSVSASYTLYDSNLTDFTAGVTSLNPVAPPAALASDYHLTLASNAIDQAIPFIWIVHDIDGQPRPMLAAPDVGADEFGLVFYLPLVFTD